MTDSERAFVLEHLMSGRESLFAAIAGISESQASFRANASDWSIADCVEHVAIVEDTLFSLIANGAPNPGGVSLDPAKDQRLAAAIVDRSRKVQAPHSVRPTGRFRSVGEAAAHFGQSRKQSTFFAETSARDLRREFCVHPLFGEIDCYRCFVLLALHPARHALQIEEIKRQAAFSAA